MFQRCTGFASQTATLGEKIVRKWQKENLENYVHTISTAQLLCVIKS